MGHVAELERVRALDRTDAIDVGEPMLAGTRAIGGDTGISVDHLLPPRPRIDMPTLLVPIRSRLIDRRNNLATDGVVCIPDRSSRLHKTRHAVRDTHWRPA